jgi:hypothetical protein
MDDHDEYDNECSAKALALAEQLGWPEAVTLGLGKATIVVPGGETGWRARVWAEHDLGSFHVMRVLEWAVAMQEKGDDPGPPELWDVRHKDAEATRWAKVLDSLSVEQIADEVEDFAETVVGCIADLRAGDMADDDRKETAVTLGCSIDELATMSDYLMRRLAREGMIEPGYADAE